MYLRPQSEFAAGNGTATTTPAALGNSRKVYRHVVITAEADLLIGPSSGSCVFKLPANMPLPVEIDDVSKIFVAAPAATVNYSYLAL